MVFNAEIVIKYQDFERKIMLSKINREQYE